MRPFASLLGVSTHAQVRTSAHGKSKETVNKSWIHYVSMAFEDNLNKNRQKGTFLHLTAQATNT